MDFTPKQKYSLLTKMGYTGPMREDMMENFIKSQPGVSSKMGKFQKALQKKVGMAEGGSVSKEDLEEKLPEADPEIREDYDRIPKSTYHKVLPYGGQEGWIRIPGQEGGSWQYIGTGRRQEEPTPKPTSDEPVFDGSQWDYTDPNQLSEAQQAWKTQMAELEAQYAATDDADERRAIEAKMERLKAEDPSKVMMQSLEAKALTDPASLVQKPDVQKIDETEGTVLDEGTGQLGKTPTGQVATGEAVTVDAAKVDDTSKYNATTVSDKAKAISEEEGTQAATSEVGKMATVQGQYEELMKDFEDGTPPWASGAMRSASARMQARGMGASSMAGQAIVQAAMEAALPIAVQDARTYAEREMANLSNEQQTRILKTQFRLNGLLSDQAAENAAKQFNAQSENEINMFRSQLEQQAAQYNASQINAMRQLNVSETNSMEKFNADMQNMRDQFNAQMSYQVSAANTQWRQFIETTDTAVQNQVNQVYTQQINRITTAALDVYWQEERDVMAFAFQDTENSKDRNLELLLGEMQKEIAMMQAAAAADSGGGIGSIVGSVLGGWASSGFSFSDRSVKKDIRKIGVRQDGLNVYKFKYKWGHFEHEGFMADEVEEVYPDAVKEDEEGFKLVDYNMIPPMETEYV